jgi:CheY-like chemotaxis protein
MARITVVDDYPDFIQMVSEILTALEGHDVAGFDGTEATVEDLVASAPDVLIVDLNVVGQGTGGVGVLLPARQDKRLRHIPMIVCSGDVAALRLHAAEFARLRTLTLEKPFGVDRLTDVVNQALNGHAAS